MAKYLGRFVVGGMTQSGRLVALYRVSSRSFPNRQAVTQPDKRLVAIVPRSGHESDIFANPYIAYNCGRIVDQTAIVANGSHADQIAEKIASGMNIRDAMALSLCIMDYEKDAYNTPRIAAVIRANEPRVWLGVVRADGIEVRAFALRPGRCVHLATYEHSIPSADCEADFDASDALDGCRFVLSRGIFADFSHPVTAVCLWEDKGDFIMAVCDVQQNG